MREHTIKYVILTIKYLETTSLYTKIISRHESGISYAHQSHNRLSAIADGIEDWLVQN